MNKYVSVYVDQDVAPGVNNREAWFKVQYGNFYARAGSIFVPYGIRLEDDTAFIRSVTGFNFDQNDDGVELGFINDRWSIQASVTNGAGGGPDNDDGKQIGARVSYVRPGWRLGFSGNFNNTDDFNRQVFGPFAGFKTGPLYWLAEYDFVRDNDIIGGAPDIEQQVALLETNIEVFRGNFLKLTFERQNFVDSDLEDRFRYSAVYEFFPWAFTELRIGARFEDSNDPIRCLTTKNFSFKRTYSSS